MCRRRQRNMPTALVSAIVVLGGNGAALADESGVSFWLLGTYATQAAVPSDPGLSIDMTYYSAGASAGRSASFARGGRIEVGLDTASNYILLTPTWTLRAEGAGRPGLVRRHRAVGQLRLDRVGDPDRAVGPQRVRRARRFDDGVRRSLSRRPR